MPHILHLQMQSSCDSSSIPVVPFRRQWRSALSLSNDEFVNVTTQAVVPRISEANYKARALKGAVKWAGAELRLKGCRPLVTSSRILEVF